MLNVRGRPRGSGRCEQALTCRDDPVFAVDVERVAGQARTWLGDSKGALEGMIAAAARVRPVDPARAAEALSEAASLRLQGQVWLMRQMARPSRGHLDRVTRGSRGRGV